MTLSKKLKSMGTKEKGKKREKEQHGTVFGAPTWWLVQLPHGIILDGELFPDMVNSTCSLLGTTNNCFVRKYCFYYSQK